jgi:hypothetical protein
MGTLWNLSDVIIGPLNNGKGQLICRFRNWKVKNSIFMKKKNLKNDEDNIFITEDLTKVRQSIIKELSTHKKAQKTKLLLDQSL